MVKGDFEGVVTAAPRLSYKINIKLDVHLLGSGLEVSPTTLSGDGQPHIS